MQDEGVDIIVEALVKIHMVHVRGARSMLRRLRAAFAENRALAGRLASPPEASPTINICYTICLE